jgi:3'-phosphoadenosine 5'-phosphosulfate sulfotransferase (PAPS reductase)/FAD synthetase
MSIRDDGDFPGESEYVAGLCNYCGTTIKILRAKRSIWEMLGTGHGVLTGDLHSRKSKVAVESFYSLCDAEKQNYDGMMWGIRAGESKGRRAHRRANGVFYDRADGKSIAQPIADWSALDVYAYIHSQEWPVQPLYLCVDPGQDYSRIRQDWFFAGGGPARYGHYVWLRRWWPDLWEKIADIDPEMRLIS